MALPAFISRHKIGVGVTTLVALPLIVFALWTTIALHYSYSSG